MLIEDVQQMNEVSSTEVEAHRDCPAESTISVSGQLEEIEDYPTVRFHTVNRMLLMQRHGR